MAYEEVGEISHRLPEGGLWLDDYYALHELLNIYRRKLPEDKQEVYEQTNDLKAAKPFSES